MGLEPALRAPSAMLPIYVLSGVESMNDFVKFECIFLEAVGFQTPKEYAIAALGEQSGWSWLCAYQW